MHRFGTEKTICEFCHQGNQSKIAKSRVTNMSKKKKKNERHHFRVTIFFLKLQKRNSLIKKVSLK